MSESLGPEDLPLTDTTRDGLLLVIHREVVGMSDRLRESEERQRRHSRDLDRLKETAKRQVWWTKLVGGTAVTGVVGAVIGWVLGKH